MIRKMLLIGGLLLVGSWWPADAQGPAPGLDSEFALCKQQLLGARGAGDELERRCVMQNTASATKNQELQQQVTWWHECAKNKTCLDWVAQGSPPAAGSPSPEGAK